MYKKGIAFLLIGLIILGIPLDVTAFSQEGKLLIYELGEDEIDVGIISVTFDDQCTEDKIINLFEIFNSLNYNGNQIQLIPKEVTIESCLFQEGHLDVIFNDRIGDYGGNTYEYFMINQLLFMVFSIEEVHTVSLFIEDKDVFTEGTQIINYTREQFDERMKLSESY